VFTTTAPLDVATLSLHDALPISRAPAARSFRNCALMASVSCAGQSAVPPSFMEGRLGTAPILILCSRVPAGSSLATRSTKNGARSEEHTSELQSRENLVCRLLLK